jgi:hypothetical protein
MSNTLGTLITCTTYGTWLRGDQRGWVDQGRIFGPDPIIEQGDRARMDHPAFRFDPSSLQAIGSAIGASLIERMSMAIYALAVDTWHCHLVIGPTERDIADVVRCMKDSVRYFLRPGRPIWTEGYDKRFCFDAPSLRARVRYVERHNENTELPAKPWPFLQPLPGD